MIKVVRFLDVFNEPEIQGFFSAYSDHDMCIALQLILSSTIRLIKNHFNDPPSIDILQQTLSDSVVTATSEKSSRIRNKIKVLQSEISLIEDALKSASKGKIPAQSTRSSRVKSLNIFRKPSSAWRSGDSPSHIIQSRTPAVNSSPVSNTQDKGTTNSKGNRYMSTEIYPEWWPEYTSAESPHQTMIKPKHCMNFHNNEKGSDEEPKISPGGRRGVQDTGLYNKDMQKSSHGDCQEPATYGKVRNNHIQSPRSNQYQYDTRLIETKHSGSRKRSPSSNYFEQNPEIIERNSNGNSPKSVDFDQDIEVEEENPRRGCNKSIKYSHLDKDTESIGKKPSDPKYKSPSSNRFEQDPGLKNKNPRSMHKKSPIYNRYEQGSSVSNHIFSSQILSPTSLKTSEKSAEANLDSAGSGVSGRNNTNSKNSRNTNKESEALGKLIKEPTGSSSSTSNWFPSPEMRNFYQTEFSKLFGQHFNERVSLTKEKSSKSSSKS